MLHTTCTTNLVTAECPTVVLPMAAELVGAAAVLAEIGWSVVAAVLVPTGLPDGLVSVDCIVPRQAAPARMRLASMAGWTASLLVPRSAQTGGTGPVV